MLIEEYLLMKLVSFVQAPLLETITAVLEMELELNNHFVQKFRPEREWKMKSIKI